MRIRDFFKITFKHPLIINLIWPQPHSNRYDQARHTRGPRTNFASSPWPSNNLLPILKNILEQVTNRKKR